MVAKDKNRIVAIIVIAHVLNSAAPKSSCEVTKSLIIVTILLNLWKSRVNMNPYIFYPLPGDSIMTTWDGHLKLETVALR